MLGLGKTLKQNKTKKSEEGQATRASATGSGGAGRGSFLYCMYPWETFLGHSSPHP